MQTSYVNVPIDRMTMTTTPEKGTAAAATTTPTVNAAVLAPSSSTSCPTSDRVGCFDTINLHAPLVEKSRGWHNLLAVADV